MIKALRGPEFASAWFGFSEPWRGTYVTGREASLRVPFIIRWPGKVPAGVVNNEIVHELDLFPTLARLADAAQRTLDAHLHVLLDPGVVQGNQRVLPFAEVADARLARPKFSTPMIRI